MPRAESQRPLQTAPTTVDTVSTQPPKIDKATDLFDMLSMDDPHENGSQSSSLDDTSWANFQCKFLAFTVVGIR